MPSRRAGGRHQAGFTLIEVLAALVVFGFLIAGLAESIRFGLTAWRVQTETVARDADLDQVDRVLSSLLLQMRVGVAGGPPAVIGSGSELAFVTQLPVRIGDPATRFAEARLVVEAGRLVLDLVPHLHAVRVGAPPPPTVEVLATGVDHVAIGYYRGSDAQWLGSWSSVDAPALVRVTVSFTDPRRRWPPIVMSPSVSRYNP